MTLRSAACAALTLAVAACATPPPTPTADVSRESRRAALHGAGSFVVVLSEPVDVDEIADVDVAILDPEPYAPDDLAALRTHGVTTLGYINIGEVEDWRAHAARVDPAWVLGENPAWPGHRFVDAMQPGWQSLVVDEIGPQVLSKGFDGLFLDMADVAAPALFPETADGIVAIVDSLRARYPMHALVMNRGLFLQDRVGPQLDGLLVEGVWAKLADGAYVRTPPAETERLVAALTRMRDAGGGAFAVEYADTDRLRSHVLAEARRADFPAYVGTRALGGPAPTARAGW